MHISAYNASSDFIRVIDENYFRNMGEIALLELIDLMRNTMEYRNMKTNVEKFSPSSIAILMNVAMQYGIDIERFKTDMQ